MGRLPGEELECFACGAAVATPPAPFTMVLPDNTPARMLAAPLSRACAALPYMQRLRRCLRLLRKMWGEARGNCRVRGAAEQKELRMQRAMWPAAKWRPNMGNNKAYLWGR